MLKPISALKQPHLLAATLSVTIHFTPLPSHVLFLLLMMLFLPLILGFLHILVYANPRSTLSVPQEQEPHSICLFISSKVFDRVNEWMGV